MALGLGRFRLEGAMAHRKPPSASPAPAAAACLQTRNPHAAGSAVGATAGGVWVPPSAVASLPAPRAPTRVPPHGRRFGACTADLPPRAAWWRQCQGTTGARDATGVDGLPLSALLEHEASRGCASIPARGPAPPIALTPTGTTARGARGGTVSDG